MSVKYICRHCQSSIGEISRDQVSEYQLGFHFLTPEERSDIIAYNMDGALRSRWFAITASRHWTPIRSLT